MEGQNWNFKTTEEIAVPKSLIDQVIGQDKAVEIMKIAAKQKRHILLIGPPGTGKSMLAQGMSELLPSEELEDVLVYPNPVMESEPIVKIVKTYPSWDYLQKNPHFIKYYTPFELAAIQKYSLSKEYNKLVDVLKVGLGRRIIMGQKAAQKRAQLEAMEKSNKLPKISNKLLILALVLIGIGISFAPIEEGLKWLLITIILFGGFLYFMSGLFSGLGRIPVVKEVGPKLIVDNTGHKKAPFVDATGTKAGALLGDVKHDPLQTGGLGTPPHLRVEAGAIHKANKGVLFIDEIASLKMNWQQELLTAMQEKKYQITGQSELSSGALVKTQPVPCDFIFVGAGNLEDMRAIHPALRSRIRGGGYEIYVETDMDDTEESRWKLVRFVAQEVKRDGKIPHFTRDAVMEIIDEARRMSGRKGKLTLNLRELGGLVRAAGDIAIEKGHRYVEREDVIAAKSKAQPIEHQLAEKIVERKKEYQVFSTNGFEVGKVNGLAVLGDSRKGLILPIVAEVTPSSSKSEGKVIATGKLGEIAKEAVSNVSAVIKKYLSDDIGSKDIHIQFLQTYEGVEGDSASISVAVSVISALKNIPVNQSIGVTGSLDVRGNVLPVGGITAKIEACIDAGLKKVVIPNKNLKDVYLSEEDKGKIEIIGVDRIEEALDVLLKDSSDKEALLKQFNYKKRKPKKGVIKRKIKRKKRREV